MRTASLISSEATSKESFPYMFWNILVMLQLSRIFQYKLKISKVPYNAKNILK